MVCSLVAATRLVQLWKLFIARQWFNVEPNVKLKSRYPLSLSKTLFAYYAVP
jgi:hypothetical protein